MRKLKRRPYPGGPQHVEPDVCGKLPSGEVCCRDPGHEDDHEQLYITCIPTKYQNDGISSSISLIDHIASLLFWFEYPASSWDETVFPEIRKDFLKRARMILEVFQK